MGDPRRLKNKYITPKKMYDKQRILEESKLKEKYGLRRNKEIWRAKTLLRNFRERARRLIAREDEREKEVLFRRLQDYGLIGRNATLEDILKLSVEDILNRRLQTIVYKKKLANSPKQARQFIVHGHVMVNGIIVRTPSYLVKVEEEEAIYINPKSSVSKIIESKQEKRKGKEERGEVENKEEQVKESEKESEDADKDNGQESRKQEGQVKKEQLKPEEKQEQKEKEKQENKGKESKEENKKEEVINE